METKKLKMIDAYCTDSINYPIPTEAATKGVLSKEVLLEISQNSQENICARVPFLIKLQASFRPAALLKKRIWHRRFPVNFAIFLKIPF